MTLKDLEFRLRQIYLIPDFGDICVALAVVAASLVNKGEVVWVLLIAPPSSFKTELINLFVTMQSAFSVGKLTPKTFLSGATDPRASLLLRMDADGQNLLLIPELGTVVSTGQQARAEVFAQLRQVYDGHYPATWGNGQQIDWKGRRYLLAGWTEEAFSYQPELAALGQRWMSYSLSLPDRDKVGRRALSNRDIDARRAEFQKATVDFLQNDIDLQMPIKMSSLMEDKLVALANLATRVRTHVPRDRRSREVEMIPHPEGPSRLIRGLGSIAESLARIRGMNEVQASDLPTLQKLALDSVPPERIHLLEHVYRHGPSNLTGLCCTTRLGQTVTRRIAEDFVALDVLEASKNLGAATLWELRPEIRQLLDILLIGGALPLRGTALASGGVP